MSSLQVPTSIGSSQISAACTYNEIQSDVNSVAAEQNGNRLAFDELCKRNWQAIMRIALRVTGNREDAEDAVQDSLLRAFVGLRRFDGRSSFSTWLTRIVINSSLMILRKRRASRNVFTLEEADNDKARPRWEIQERGLDPETSLAQGEEEAILHEAIRSLRPGLRAALEIERRWGLPIKAGAEALGISVAAMKSRLSRGKWVLRRKLMAKGVAPQTVRFPNTEFGGMTSTETRNSGRQLSPLQAKEKAARYIESSSKGRLLLSR